MIEQIPARPDKFLEAFLVESKNVIPSIKSKFRIGGGFNALEDIDLPCLTIVTGYCSLLILVLSKLF